MKVNIAMAGGGCTGKSTLAAALFADLKVSGLDYDLITEQSRSLKREFGSCKNPFDRFYLWRQQEREELRSTAINGFITDTALFQYYVQAKQWVKEPRDNLAVRELLRMCLELEYQNRYQLLVMADNPNEIPYKKDQSRKGNSEKAMERHRLLRSFIEHHMPRKLVVVNGSVKKRVITVKDRLFRLMNI